MLVKNAKWRIRNLVSTRHRKCPMFQEPMLPSTTTKVSLCDSDVHAIDMQTIEDDPRGKELEPDNNPQASVLQQPKYLAIRKSPSVNATPNTSSSSTSGGQQEQIGLRSY